METTTEQELEEQLGEEFDILLLANLQERNKLTLLKLGVNYYLIWYEQKNGKYEIYQIYKPLNQTRKGYVKAAKPEDIAKTIGDIESRKYYKGIGLKRDLERYLNNEEVRQERSKNVLEIENLLKQNLFS